MDMLATKYTIRYMLSVDYPGKSPALLPLPSLYMAISMVMM